ncbi:MAG: hypothetical protein FWE55_00125 [Synergistaceae bacterium]|nr:hypothetical protein [Synergistaceae bacterium]
MESFGIIDKEMVGLAVKQKRRPFVFRGKKGSSLAEMLIAILVLGVVLISMLGMFVISRTAIFTKEDETAYALALRYLEEMEARDYSTFVTGVRIPLSAAPGDTRYDVTAEVTSMDNYAANVTVEVTWSGAALGQKTLKMERVISAIGYRNVGEMQH